MNGGLPLLLIHNILRLCNEILFSFKHLLDVKHSKANVITEIIY